MKSVLPLSLVVLLVLTCNSDVVCGDTVGRARAEVTVSVSSVGTVTRELVFSVEANVEQVWFAVAVSNLYKAGAPTGQTGYQIPVSGSGAIVEPGIGSPTQGGSTLLEWVTQQSVDPDNWLYNKTKWQEYESNEDGYFSQDIKVTVQWDLQNPELPAGDYKGWVELTVSIEAPPTPSDNQPPAVPVGLIQLKSDAQTKIVVGGATDEDTVVFKAKVSDPDGDKVKLQIELRRLDEYGGNFLNESTQESGYVDGGSEATIAVFGLVNGNYHWQIRAVDEKGLPSEWTQFGSNDISETDFVKDPDIYWLGKVIASEVGSIHDKYLGEDVRCTNAERASVGWTVINRRNVKMWGCETIEQVVTFPGQYAHGQVPNREIVELSRDLLDGRIPDPTGGATHFFSPIGMPKEGEPRNGYDTSGGLHWVPKPSNITALTYFPSFGAKDIHKPGSVCPGYTSACASDTHEWIGPIAEVHNDYVMVYRSKMPKLAAKLHSPGELRVYDSEGRVTGVVGGTLVVGIPGSQYSDNTVVISFPQGFYRYEVVGTGGGVYGLAITATTTDGEIAFVATGIATCANAVHQYVIDWGGLSQGRNGVTLQIDAEGDGSFEQAITAGGVLETPQISVNGLVGISSTRAALDAKTGQFSVNVTVRNTSSTVIGVPVWLVMDSISNPAVTLVKTSGTTTDGKPYIDLSGLLGDGKLDPGETVTQRVCFNNPKRVSFTFKSSVRGVVSP